MQESKEFEFNVDDSGLILELFGQFDENIKLIEEAFGVTIISRDKRIKISGANEGIESAHRVIDRLVSLSEKGGRITPQSVGYAISLADSTDQDKGKKYDDYYDIILTTAKGKKIETKTMGQKEYAHSIRNNHITFGIGPAGTGKTYIAVAMAVLAFKSKEVERIVLTRPAVEAGEKLGFLPGDLQEKINPYLRPLYDALYDFIGPDSCRKYLDRGIIEIAPLAYMRGRTLDNSFIILDEAQNTTSEQMKMFLTRLGLGSKAVITGDVTQVDLPKDKVSGVVEAQKILKGVKGIGFVQLTQRDVVRHRIVERIIEAYSRYEGK